MKILRSMLAIVLGIVATVLTIMAVQFVSMAMHPMPAGLDMNDQAGMRAWMATLSARAFAMVLVSYVAGSFVGGGVSALIAGWGHLVHAGIIGALVVLITVVNFRQFPGVHPDWMMIASYLLPVPAALLAGWLAASLQRAPKLERS